MAPDVLDATRRGTEQCFVCEPAGTLSVSFSHEAEERTVVAEVTFTPEQQGHDGRVHPGAALAVLEDAMLWAVSALGATPGVPKRTTTEFLRPIKPGVAYRVVGRLISRHPDGLDVAATLLRDEDALPCAEARARYLPLGEDSAPEG